MQPTRGPEVSSELLIESWSYCRLIGIINKIYFSFLAFVFILYASAILIDCISCGDNNKCNQLCASNTEQKGVKIVVAIVISILTTFCIKMVYVNGNLRSTEIPEDINKVKLWVYWHIISFVIHISEMLADGKMSFIIIVIVVHGVEIYVVRRFIKDFEISTGRSHQSLNV